MDPPNKFVFHLDHGGLFWWKLKMTSLVFCFNSVIALFLMVTTYYVLSEETTYKIIQAYVNKHKLIFAEQNWINFLLFLNSYCLRAPVAEEFIYRYPIILLLRKKFGLGLMERNLTKVLILLTILLLNGLWSYDHIWITTQPFQKNYYHLLPPFLVGLPLYWLVIKTRTLWPAILCHGALNFSLYVIAQLMVYLKIDPVYVIVLLLKAEKAMQPALQ